jgi:hypothetical protein
MQTWFKRIQDNLGVLPECINYFDAELQQARYDCTLKGNVEKLSREIPQIVEHRFNQLQEIEAILENLNIQLRQIRSKKYRQFLEHYQRALTSRDAEKYIDGEDEVVTMQQLVNEFALIRNKFQGVIKALDAKQFQINNVIKLRVAGLDDVTL